MKHSIAVILLMCAVSCGWHNANTGTSVKDESAAIPEPENITAIQDAESGPAATLQPVFSIEEIGDSIRQRIVGKSYNPDLCPVSLDDLRYLRLSYYDFDGLVCEGELICNEKIADDLLDIFKQLYDAQYQLACMRLVDDFDADDEKSMAADNTSCFNCRYVSGTGHFSQHAYGLAVDINPLENPYVRGEKVSPSEGAAYADRSVAFEHKIDTEDLCYRLFRERGFAWGGAWRSVKDYQHFEKRLQ